MTKEEAIYLLNNLRSVAEGKEDEALDMAIEALSADAVHTCNTCADKALCIMSAPDGNWRACKDYRPSADRPTIVRCKDCEYYTDGKCYYPHGYHDVAVYRRVNDNDFCSWAKMKGGAE